MQFTAEGLDLALLTLCHHLEAIYTYCRASSGNIEYIQSSQLALPCLCTGCTEASGPSHPQMDGNGSCDLSSYAHVRNGLVSVANHGG